MRLYFYFSYVGDVVYQGVIDFHNIIIAVDLNLLRRAHFDSATMCFIKDDQSQ